jgi:hypothetical protein
VARGLIVRVETKREGESIVLLSLENAAVQWVVMLISVSTEGGSEAVQFRDIWWRESGDRESLLWTASGATVGDILRVRVGSGCTEVLAGITGGQGTDSQGGDEERRRKYSTSVTGDCSRPVGSDVDIGIHRGR